MSGIRFLRAMSRMSTAVTSKSIPSTGCGGRCLRQLFSGASNWQPSRGRAVANCGWVLARPFVFLVRQRRQLVPAFMFLCLCRCLILICATECSRGLVLAVHMPLYFLLRQDNTMGIPAVFEIRALCLQTNASVAVAGVCSSPGWRPWLFARTRACISRGIRSVFDLRGLRQSWFVPVVDCANEHVLSVSSPHLC